MEGSRHEQDPMVFQFCREVRWGWGKTKPLGGWFKKFDNIDIPMQGRCKWIYMNTNDTKVSHLSSCIPTLWTWPCMNDHLVMWSRGIPSHLKMYWRLGNWASQDMNTPKVTNAIHLSPAPKKKLPPGVTASIVLTPSTQGWRLGWGDGTWGRFC